MKSLKTFLRNLKISIIVIIMFSCNKSNHDSKLLFGKEFSVSYDIYKKTKYTPSVRNTYIFQKNGNLYHLTYSLKQNSVRYANSDDFFEPSKWKIKKDSLFFENFYYKINKKGNNLYLSRKDFDTIILKKNFKNFEIIFYAVNDTIYVQDVKGDTIRKFTIINE